MLVPQSCERCGRSAKRGGLSQVRAGGSLWPFVPTSGISDGTFCEFYIGFGTVGDHYICKKSTV